MAAPSFPFPVVFFDGVCNLCNGVVQFLIVNNKDKTLHFASLQSDAGVEVLRHLGHKTDGDPDSIIFYENGKLMEKSRAVLAMAAHLPWYYSWVRVFGILPTFILDAMYAFVAANRYRFFGKKDECMLPRPEWKARFLPEKAVVQNL